MSKILGIFVVVCGLLLNSSAFAFKKGNDVENEICNAEFKLQYPKGMNHVLFTVVREDPMEHFKKKITVDREKLIKIKLDQKIEGTNISEKKNTVVNYWNYVLDTVTGSHIWDLQNNVGKNTPFKHGHRTNCLPKAWLVTRMIGADDGAIGWSIPLNFKKGKTIEVKLTPDNAIKFKKLEKVYDSIVK